MKHLRGRIVHHPDTVQASVQGQLTSCIRNAVDFVGYTLRPAGIEGQAGRDGHACLSLPDWRG